MELTNIKTYANSVNISTLYREVFAALIDAMHRKFDKNAHAPNQLKTWDHSVKIVDKLLSIAKMADIPRVFFFYLKVKRTILSKNLSNFAEEKNYVENFTLFYSRIRICISSCFCSTE